MKKNNLDLHAKVLGLKRKRKFLFFKESDKDFRKRMLDVIRGVKR